MGDCSDLMGNISEANLSENDREIGIDIRSLIKDKE